MLNKKFVYLILIMAVAFSVIAPSVALATDEEEAEIWLPENLTTDLRVKAAYNGEQMFWLFEWKTPDGGNLFHDVLVYQDGAWVKRGDSGEGADIDGLREDRVILMVDAGNVPGFANQGCYTACHNGMDSMSDKLDADTVKAALGEEWGRKDIRKYVPISRNGENWWDAAWDQPKSKEELAALVEAGVFLDMWHWRSVRSGPIGYSDDQYVLEYRNSDPGKSSVGTNWDDETKLPKVMFDPAKVGYAALNWDKLQAGEYSQNDVYYLDSSNSVAYDPNYAWKNGDVIPRRILRMPEGGMADILADGRLTNGVWQVELSRAMVTETAGDIPMVEGRVYNVGIAVHSGATGARWHQISHTVKVGIGVNADVTAVRFNGDKPDWNSMDWTTITLYYPGQVTWDWLVTDAHPGAPEVRADSRSCQSCHGDSAQDALKLAQASVFHETQDSPRSLNWYLTLLALVSLFGGGTYFVLAMFNTKK